MHKTSVQNPCPSPVCCKSSVGMGLAISRRTQKPWPAHAPTPLLPQIYGPKGFYNHNIVLVTKIIKIKVKPTTFSDPRLHTNYVMPTKDSHLFPEENKLVRPLHKNMKNLQNTFVLCASGFGVSSCLWFGTGPLPRCLSIRADISGLSRAMVWNASTLQRLRRQCFSESEGIVFPDFKTMRSFFPLLLRSRH